MAAGRILIVDDDESILNLLSRFLKQCGYTVATASEWEAGLNMFSQDSYDLVLLDVHMPGRDGFQVARDIRQCSPDQKIMIITGLSAGEVFQYFRDIDVEIDEVLYKPFSLPKVQKLIENLLAH